jgi:hypothetical protein
LNGLSSRIAVRLPPKHSSCGGNLIRLDQLDKKTVGGETNDRRAKMQSNQLLRQYPSSCQIPRDMFGYRQATLVPAIPSEQMDLPGRLPIGAMMAKSAGGLMARPVSA